MDPANPDVVYTMGTCVYRSTDGGHTLVAFKGAPGGDDPNQWWIDPTNPRHIVYGGDQGASISLDAGRTWSLWYNQPTGEMYKVTTDNRFPYWIYGTKQDSGAVAVASRGIFGQVTDLDWFPLPGWETGFVAIDPANPDVIYSSGNLGFLQRLDRRTWGAQSVDPGVGAISAVSDTDYRRAISPPIVFSPQDPHTLYYGTQNVWATRDGGDHWQKLSPDLTAHPGKPPLPPPEGVHHGDALESLSPSKLKRRGDLDRQQQRRGLPDPRRRAALAGCHAAEGVHARVVNIQASAFDPAEAYAAVDGFGDGDDAPHIYRTRDYGKTWQSHHRPACRPTSPPAVSCAWCAKTRTSRACCSPARKPRSTCRSTMATIGNRCGSTCRPPPTYDLEIHDGDLIAATYGRAIWILDDISPLEQMRADDCRRSPGASVPSRAGDPGAGERQPGHAVPARGAAREEPAARRDHRLLAQATRAQRDAADPRRHTARWCARIRTRRCRSSHQPAPPAPRFWARPRRALAGLRRARTG